jgi:hypothetical protein
MSFIFKKIKVFSCWVINGYVSQILRLRLILCADTPLPTSTKTWISSTCSLTTITHHRSQRSTITHHSTGMEVSALITGASGQPSLTSDHSTVMEVYSTVTHHRTQRSAIPHHSLIKGARIGYHSPLYRCGSVHH